MQSVLLSSAEDFRNSMSNGGAGLFDFLPRKAGRDADFQRRLHDLFWLIVIRESL